MSDNRGASVQSRTSFRWEDFSGNDVDAGKPLAMAGGRFEVHRLCRGEPSQMSGSMCFAGGASMHHNGFAMSKARATHCLEESCCSASAATDPSKEHLDKRKNREKRSLCHLRHIM